MKHEEDNPLTMNTNPITTAHKSGKNFCLTFTRWSTISYRSLLYRICLVWLIMLPILGCLVLCNPLRRGLIGQYYDNLDGSGSPMMTVKESSITLDRLKTVFPARQTGYSIAWSGVMFIPETGTYALTSSVKGTAKVTVGKHLVLEHTGLKRRQEYTRDVRLA
ncbi:MAG: hypothetical protein GY801_30765, partial [bacterium]|nr:hypothetical protein [bacterium]